MLHADRKERKEKGKLRLQTGPVHLVHTFTYMCIDTTGGTFAQIALHPGNITPKELGADPADYAGGQASIIFNLN